MTDASPPDRPEPARPARRPPERVDGPTPNGGAYCIAYYGADDRLAEIVEFDAADREIRRTYCAGSGAFKGGRSEAEDLGRNDEIDDAPIDPPGGL